MSAKHARGPWFVGSRIYNPGYIEVVHKNDLLRNHISCAVAKLPTYKGRVKEQYANATLIATSPELLEELKKITRHFLTTTDPEVAALVRSSLKVIAKAVGEPT